MLNELIRRRDVTIPVAGTIASAFLLFAVFSRYLPGPNGLGHDYALFLPAVLAERYSALEQGLWSTVWFTPAFCGGVPLFADAQWGFFALPSMLVRVTGLDPIESLRLTFALFVALGFIGTYLFTLRRLGVSIPGSVLAAFLFASNGFFVYRFLVGHLGFHGVALIPLMAYFATSSAQSGSIATVKHLIPIVGMSLISAYWIHSGAVSILPAFIFATAALVLLQWLRGGSVRTTLLRTTLGAILGLSLAASKLVAGLSFLANAPRTGYSLPGFVDLLTTIKLTASMLFLNDSTIATVAARSLQNAQWLLDRHELEFGVTTVPVLLAVIALAVRLFAKPTPETPPQEFSISDPKFNSIPLSQFGFGVALFFILAIPILLNTYSPEWNAFLKGLPILGSTSSYIRWILIYIPILACASGMLVDQISPRWRAKVFLTGTAVIMAAIQVIGTDREFYSAQNYNPQPILDAFEKSKSADFAPRINRVDAYVNQSGQIVLTGNRNDLLVDGVSQLACYNPAFGYQLEFFPLNSLTFGDALARQGNNLNIKNPACYVYPEENACLPGDHFRTEQLAEAERFVSYGKFEFKKSRAQQFADFVNALALFLCAILIGWRIYHRSVHLRQLENVNRR